MQIPAADNYNPTIFYDPEYYLDSSEMASIKRLNIIAQGHPQIFNVLSDFMHVEFPKRRIIIIKGNRDVNLFWPNVKKRLREILGASGTRASLLRFANEFVSREKIYVEHGHQRAEKINRFPDSFDSRLPSNPYQLYYPIGSRFVIDFVNNVERDWWFVDNVRPFTTLVWSALAFNFDLALKALAVFIRYRPVLATSNGASGNITPAMPDTLLQDLENEDKHKELSQRYSNDPSFRQHLHHQIQQLFNETNMNEAGIAAFPLPEISNDPEEMGRAYQKQQQRMLRQAAEKIAAQEGSQVILFGHSHHPVQETLSNGAVYVNTGSWIENFFDISTATWQNLFKNVRKRGDIPFGLPYACINYDHNNNPSAELLYFNQPKELELSTPVKAIPKTKVGSSDFFEKNFSWLTRFLKAGN